jgi:hypothetical protein
MGDNSIEIKVNVSNEYSLNIQIVKYLNTGPFIGYFYL